MATQNIQVFIDLEILQNLLLARFEEQPLLLLAHLTIERHSDSQEYILCLNCHWSGPEHDLIAVPDAQEDADDNYILHPYPVPVCPRCRSTAWETIDNQIEKREADE
jgi:hypothetical protein